MKRPRVASEVAARVFVGDALNMLGRNTKKCESFVGVQWSDHAACTFVFREQVGEALELSVSWFAVAWWSVPANSVPMNIKLLKQVFEQRDRCESVPKQVGGIVLVR